MKPLKLIILIILQYGGNKFLNPTHLLVLIKKEI